MHGDSSISSCGNNEIPECNPGRTDGYAFQTLVDSKLTDKIISIESNNSPHCATNKCENISERMQKYGTLDTGCKFLLLLSEL
jgi:hypothetical protein